MSAGLWGVQKAVYDALKTADVAAGKVHDDVPESDSTAFPYVQIGESQAVAADVDCRAATEEFLNLHIWSRHPGWMEIKQIGGEIHAALHAASLTAEGRSVCRVFVDTMRTLRDPDGRTRHGVLTLKIFHAD